MNISNSDLLGILEGSGLARDAVDSQFDCGDGTTCLAITVPMEIVLFHIGMSIVEYVTDSELVEEMHDCIVIIGNDSTTIYWPGITANDWVPVAA